MGMAIHIIPSTGQMRLTTVYQSHILTTQGIPHAMWDHREVILGGRVNKQKLRKTNFVVARWGGVPWFCRRIYSAGGWESKCATLG